MLEGMDMKTHLTTVPVGVSWLASKLGKWKQKRKTQLVRLRKLKETGLAIRLKR